eukprot:COSAG05_NODE_12_length_37297_cov_117.537072_37_plen_485_part_00
MASSCLLLALRFCGISVSLGLAAARRRPVPRHHWQSAEASVLLAAQEPVVLTGTGFVDFAAKQWTDEHLLKHWDQGADEGCFTLQSTMKAANGAPMFYYTDRLGPEMYNMGMFDHDPTLVTANVSTMARFVEEQPIRPELGRAEYLQSAMLATHSQTSIGPVRKEGEALNKCFSDKILAEVTDEFDWTVPRFLRSEFGWWPEKEAAQHPWLSPWYNDQLWVGDNGLVTPLHYDILHGMLCQIRGRKRVTIFPPSDFHAMLPLPATHPGARGSNIFDLDNMSKAEAKAFATAEGGREVVIGPGDALIIPDCWWHHVEQIPNVDGSKEHIPISLTLFWRDERYKRTLKNTHDLMRRRLDAERLITQSLTTSHGGILVAEYMRALDKGRFDPACKKKHRCARPTLQDLHDGIQHVLKTNFAEKSELRGALGKNETIDEFMRWMVKGRFNLPTTTRKIFHVSYHVRPPARTTLWHTPKRMISRFLIFD